MPPIEASTRAAPETKPQTGLLEHERRYLRRSILILCVVFGLLNLVGCRLLFGDGKPDSMMQLRRSGWSTYTNDYWPSIPPKPWEWPRPERRADFSGVPFGSACYATAWEDGTHYSMDVYAIGFPLSTYDVRTLRIIEHDGTVVLAEPPIGATPRVRLSLVGLGVNTMLQAGVVWVLIALLPCGVAVLERGTLARKWEEQWLCPGCGYDVQDLPICPECGRRNATRYTLKRVAE